MRTPYVICCSALVSLLVLAVPASSVPPPAPSPDQLFDLRYTTGKPGVRTGLRLLLGERVPETTGLPKLRTATVTLPAGMRFDRSAATHFCRESDSAHVFPVYGAPCLPAAIGAGELQLISPPEQNGRENPRSDALAYNTRRGVLIQARGLPTGISLTFRGRAMTLTFPNPGFLSITSLQLYLNPLSQRRRVRRHGRTLIVRRNLFTTPARCPSSGMWSSSVTATFYDEPTPRTSVSTSPCRR